MKRFIENVSHKGFKHISIFQVLTEAFYKCRIENVSHKGFKHISMSHVLTRILQVTDIIHKIIHNPILKKCETIEVRYFHMKIYIYF